MHKQKREQTTIVVNSMRRVNTHTLQSDGARFLGFGPNFHLYTNLVCTNKTLTDKLQGCACLSEPSLFANAVSMVKSGKFGRSAKLEQLL